MVPANDEIFNILVNTYRLENIVRSIADILDESVTENIEYREIDYELNLWEMGLCDASRIKVLWDIALILYGSTWNKCIYCDKRKEAAEWFRNLAKED